MAPAHAINEEQIKLWNGPAARAWVEGQALLDQTLEPFADLLVTAVSAGPGGALLDVGCGTGATLLGLARRHAGARLVGIDVSEPMLELARARVEQAGANAELVLGDAQEHAFQPARFDGVISRFGIMFFADPVRAFANIRRAAKDDAALSFVAWRSPAENPFMTTAERAAAPLLPDLPPRKPDAPGQFAFANGDRVRDILKESGWIDIEIRPIDVDCAFPAKELERYVTRLGPVGVALQEADDRTRAKVTSVVREAFQPYVKGSEVRFKGASWMVGARSGPTPR